MVSFGTPPPRPDPANIKKAMDFDPLAELEKATGKKLDDLPLAAGLGVVKGVGDIRRELLMKNRDLFMGISLEGMKSVLAELGFQCIYWEPFCGNDPDKTEYLYAYWHPTKYLFFCGDSYGGDHINGATVYATWKIREDLDPKVYENIPEHYSGGWEPDSEDVKQRSDAYRDLFCEARKATGWSKPFEDLTWQQIVDATGRDPDEVRHILLHHPSLHEYSLVCNWNYIGMRHYLEDAERKGTFTKWLPEDNHRFVWFIHYADKNRKEGEDWDTRSKWFNEKIA